MSVARPVDDVLIWYAQMVQTVKMLPPVERAEFDRWERENLDGGTVGSSDWPGFARHLPPKPCLDEPGTRKAKKAIPPTLRTAVFERDLYRCLACGAHVDLRADHVVAEVNGGPTTFENLQTLCASCNSRKGTSSVDYRR